MAKKRRNTGILLGLAAAAGLGAFFVFGKKSRASSPDEYELEIGEAELDEPAELEQPGAPEPALPVPVEPALPVPDEPTPVAPAPGVQPVRPPRSEPVLPDEPEETEEDDDDEPVELDEPEAPELVRPPNAPPPFVPPEISPAPPVQQQPAPPRGGGVTLPPQVAVPLPGGQVNVPLPAPGDSVELPGGGSVRVPDIVRPPRMPASPLPSVPVIPTPPAAPPPVADAPVEAVPVDTQTMVSALRHAETLPNWKKVESSVRQWQQSRSGLVADGKLGPGTALRIAEETGDVPLVRYWPRSAGARPDLALEDFKLKILELAQQAPEPRRSKLIAHTEREQGQSFGPPQGTRGKRPVLA